MEHRDLNALEARFPSRIWELRPQKPLGGVAVLVPVSLLMLLAAVVCLLLVPWEPIL